VPRKLENVLVAGRCVSADRMVHGSIRVMPGCFITGQAAGVAAAMSAEGGRALRQIDVAELQRQFKAVGTYLPNCWPCRKKRDGTTVNEAKDCSITEGRIASKTRDASDKDPSETRPTFNRSWTFSNFSWDSFPKIAARAFPR